METVYWRNRHDTKNIAKAGINEGTLFLLFCNRSRPADRDDQCRCRHRQSLIDVLINIKERPLVLRPSLYLDTKIGRLKTGLFNEIVNFGSRLAMCPRDADLLSSSRAFAV